MFCGMKSLSLEQEMDRILAEYESKLPPIMAMVERQFTVLHNRAQVLLALCGIVISTTGFSGRLIAGTNVEAQVAVIVGVGFILLSAGVVAWGVLHLKWLSLQPGDTTRQWLESCLRYRDTKTHSYRLGVVLMLIGLTAYCLAISIMLVNPHTDVLPAR